MHVIVEIMLLRHWKAFMQESERATATQDQLGTHRQEEKTHLNWATLSLKVTE